MKMLRSTFRVARNKKCVMDNSRTFLNVFFRTLRTESSTRSKTFDVNQNIVRIGDVVSPSINFDYTNTEMIFKTKRTSEILRALVVLSICSIDSLADNSERLMKLSEKILGKHVFEALMRKTFYGQFVAGRNKEEVHMIGERLREAGIHTMIYIPIEADDPESTVSDYKAREDIFDNNVDVALDSVKTTEKGEFTQMRITPFCSPHLLRTLTENLTPFKETVEKPEPYTLDSFARGLDKNFEGTILPDLDDGSNEHLKRSLRRLDKLAECAESHDVRLMIDSEHTFMQAGISHLIMTMQYKYNRNKPVVFNTYQAYLKDTNGRLGADLKLLNQNGVLFGTKLVRGAYMELERKRAAKQGYEDPIYPTAEATHENYEKCVEIIMKEVARGHAHFMVATHNQTSVKKALERMKELQIPPDSGAVIFGQIYGMCDQLSYALGAAGYPTYKSVPYGSVEDTLLYLTRRAKENKTVIAGARKEKDILKKELLRRISTFKS